MRLSVIVTVVDGGDALRRCLTGLAAQEGAPGMEVIVPCDDSAPDVAGIVAAFPSVRHLPLGELVTAAPAHGPAGQHELFDRRRSAGLAVASGELVAIVEDRGVPRPDWAREASRLHASMPHAVIGGAVENGRDRTLNWAVYFCDFGRYQLPLREGPAAYATDVDICYKRAAIESTRDLWRERYHETTVHWALQRAGEALYLHPAMVVDQHRDGLRLGALVKERRAWGRLFAYTRAREIGFARRVALTVLSPALPFLLLLRHGRMQWAKRRTFGKYLRAAPAVFVLLAAWSFGEMLGYATAKP
jgi:hypothetical protein